ncbi:nucleoid-associated protein [Cupriavidus necator]|uniref:nucleoid-associated protein n=1 Tax=Cupriavidus necator TaxID=106590 RepID=UPI003F7326FF
MDFLPTGQGPGSFFQRAAALMHASDDEFLEHSQAVALKLASAQVGHDLAASKLVVMSGTSGVNELPFCAVVKAELHDGFGDKEPGKDEAVSYIKNLFLTPTQRLYKIGFVQQMERFPRPADGVYSVDRYAVHLFDHLMTATESRNAAFYFYGRFLETDIASSDRRLTADFYDRTKDFIESLAIPRSDKIDLTESLRAELRSNDLTVNAREFAEKHLPMGVVDEYCSFVEKKGLPAHSFTKNTEYIKSKLKKRQRLVLSSDVIVTVPADQMKKLVKIEPSGEDETILRIQGAVVKNE